MKKPFRHRLPRFLGKFLRRCVVRVVGACVYVVGDLLDIAVGNGLDLDPLWPRELDHVEWPWASGGERRKGRGGREALHEEAGAVGSLPPLNVEDFFLLLDAASGAARPAGTEAEPVIASIIIPAYNRVDYTFQCLRSLMREVDLRRHEIIVVDDGSEDGTARLLSHLRSAVRAVGGGENRGFVHACNLGAEAARGRYLVFLNNDTLARPGWLEHLVRTAEEDPSVGAVGSMLVYPDGTLQEAGGVVWRDGSAWNYGRGEDAAESRFRYARDADYCGGASLLVRKSLFDSLGGFDERYAPAYYEDVDLCFGVRSLGFRVVYQPMSRVVHYEGGTAGTDLQAGVKQYQRLNRAKFYAKWRGVLELEHAEYAPDAVERAARGRGGPRVAVFDEMFSSPTGDAGSLRMVAVLRALAKRFRPVFVNVRGQLPRETEDLLGGYGVEVVRLPDYKTHPSAYAEFFKSNGFHAAVLSRPAIADALLPLIRECAPDVKVIYDTVDIHFLRLEREYGLTGDEGVLRVARALREQEMRLASLSDQVWCVTPADGEVLAREGRTSEIKIVPVPHPPQGRGPGFDERQGLLFVGNFNHSPNRDAVRHFVGEVFPLVRAALPGAKFYVVGHHTPEEIAALHSEDVLVKGYVSDLAPLFNGCRVFVAPLRFGAGMKGKIIQALAYGLPTVTTSIGAEGIGLRHTQEALIADSAEDFAAAVVELYGNRELWGRTSEAGYEYVRSHYAPEMIEAKVLAAMRELEGGGGDGGEAPTAAAGLRPLVQS